MKLSTSNFGAFHAAVHGGRDPFAWQQRLLEQIVHEKVWPRAIDLPTSVGKTTCIDIALFALALDAENTPGDRWCPRRIAMVVDRRIVVDQVAERGRTILRALSTSADAIVVEIARRLRSLNRDGIEPFGVFTLRGGMPKDDGWARSPDQPLVIASTVDQFGSRLLMQGYGVSQSMKPVHAGLLANDTLLLLDEVHLSEPFRQTLDQLARLRSRFSTCNMQPRFAHVFLSATPSSDTATSFKLLDDEKGSDSPLSARLHTNKPTRLLEVDNRTALEAACVEEAKALLNRHRTIAIVVNRVSSAVRIASYLSEALDSEAKVTLLTGRMRPLDRDDVLRDLRPAIETGRKRSPDTLKRVVVGTQCIEAGADFDFDALVTEAASLDSLRQRFGRLDRLGEYKRSEGVIVHDRSAKDDLIYGSSCAETMKWLKQQERERPRRLKEDLRKLKATASGLSGEAKERAEEHLKRVLHVDFGVLSLAIPTGQELDKLLAPKPSAPTLLPAYLDLWAQTAPTPRQVPDVSLWLHGPKCGPPDVQVIWRADLEQALECCDVELAIAIVAAVRPSSLEGISLPFGIVRAWLANQRTPELDDVEGSTADDRDNPQEQGRRALRWNGDQSEIVFAQSESERGLRPGDTIVVPASYGGIRNGCFDPTSTDVVEDRAEQAELFARARPVLRLHSKVVAGLGLSLPLQDADAARSSLVRFAPEGEISAWKRLWAERLAKGKQSAVVPANEPWTVIYGDRISIAEFHKRMRPEDTVEGGVELTTDGDDSCHAGRAIPLGAHTEHVERLSREYAAECGLSRHLVEHVAMAAWLHDIGKADRRFQLMLRGGSEIEFFKDATLWAKSGMLPGARKAHRIAGQKSGYPVGARHEVQSLAMVQASSDALIEIFSKAGITEPDLDLVLHLIATHHGHCRPFAPAVVDDSPVDVAHTDHTSKAFGKVNFTPMLSCNMLHRLDSPLADRFWRLIAKYGWQELCWLESILRLADHRASEQEQKIRHLDE